MNDNLGGVITNKSGYLDVNKFIIETRKYLISRGNYKEYNLKSDNILVGKKHLKVGGWRTKYLIFCIGAHQIQSRFFSWLPFNLNKGEIINIEMNLELNKIIQKSIIIVPQNKNEYTVGSTYEWENLTHKNTRFGINKIRNKLDSIINCKYKIKEKKFGIRPASRNKRPFVGLHAKYNKIGILNGLGSKGVSLTPYCTKNLLNNILEKKMINKEINIKRYISLYS